MLARLATASTIVCRRTWDSKSSVPSSVTLDAPFDTLLVAPSIRGAGKATDYKEDVDESHEVRLGLLKALSSSEYSDAVPRTLGDVKSRSMDASMRDPSTSELLAMAAVSLAQSYEHDSETTDCVEKVVPCQRRAGKLRGKW